MGLTVGVLSAHFRNEELKSLNEEMLQLKLKGARAAAVNTSKISLSLSIDGFIQIFSPLQFLLCINQ